jgi:hypothetical protein
MSFNTNGVNLKGQFHLKNTDPIDSRYIIASAEEYKALLEKDNDVPKFLYPGLTFAVLTDFTTDDGQTISKGIYQVNTDYQVARHIQIGTKILTESQVENLTILLNSIDFS